MIVCGVPTAPVVEKLRKAIGVPVVGDVIPYTKLEGIIEAGHRTLRFRTVSNAWRSFLFRECNVFLEAVPGVGFRALDPHGRIRKSSKFAEAGLRKIMRGGVLAAKTETGTLTREELQTRDHLILTAAKARLARSIEKAPLDLTSALGIME